MLIEQQLKLNYVSEEERIRLKNVGDLHDQWKKKPEEVEQGSWQEVARANRVKGGI